MTDHLDAGSVRNASESRVALPLSRSGLIAQQMAWIISLGLYFNFPLFLPCFIFAPSMWPTWLLFLPIGFIVAGLVSETPSAIVTIALRRPPIVMDDNGISVRGLRPIAWDGVREVRVDDYDDEVTVELTADELDRRGYNPVTCLSDDRTGFRVPLAWIDAEPAVVSEHARRFLNASSRR